MLLFFFINFIKFGRINNLQLVLRVIKSNIFKFVRKIKFYLNMDKTQTSNNGITSQTITFKAGDKQHCFEIKDKHVTIVGSTGNHDHGSSKVKLKNVVDYKWEQKNYPGRLIAVHLDGDHLAYRINVNNHGFSEGMIRILNRKTNERSLIKGMSNEILDLQFAHIENKILLACIEETALHVFAIHSKVDKISWNVLLKINDPIPGHVPKYDKINWCPFVPEKNNVYDVIAGQLLVWVRGKQFQYYSVETVIQNYGCGVFDANDIVEGCLKYTKSTHAITNAIFSPDGTTLAISSEDGIVRFYQVYLHADETNPRCLHEWNPHEGKAISCLFFLDNHKLFIADGTLWIHAITGAENNTELKLWSCETWECTQTIVFNSSFHHPFNFKVEIDRTSSYLILTDMKNRGLYVLQIMKDSDNDELKYETDSKGEMLTTSKEDLIDLCKSENITHNTSGSATESNNGMSSFVFIKSIAEFPLSSPILSFGIVDAAVRKYKCGISDGYLVDELEDYDEENNSLYCVVIKMYIVQPKSLQECHVLYQPTLYASADVKSTLSYIESNVDSESKESLEIDSETSSLVLSNTPKSQVAPSTHGQINLMTPDSFNSSGKKTPETVSSEVMYTLFMLANATSNKSPDINKKSLESMGLMNIINNKVIEEQEKEKIKKSVELQQKLTAITQQPIASSKQTIKNSSNNISTLTESEPIASGGSSPSREVQEILSLKDSDILNDYYDDSDNAIMDDADGFTSGNLEIINDFDNIITNKLNLNSSDNIEKHNETNSIKTDWPEVPEVPIMITQPPPHSTTNSDQIPMDFTAKRIAHVHSKQMDFLCLKMEQMFEIIQTQTQEIEKLRNQVNHLHKSQAKELAFNKTTTNAAKLETSLGKLLENYLIRYERAHGQKLDSLLKTHEKQNIELKDALLHSVTQILFHQISERITPIFVGELQRHTLPLVAAKLDNIKQQIQLDIAQKLTSSDQLLRDNIAQVCTSKAIVDTFGSSILLGVQNGLQSTYVETLSSTLIPAYEKCTQQMLQQMRQTFLNGTTEFTKQFELYMTQFETQSRSNDEILEYVQLLPHEIKTHNEKTINLNYSKITNDVQGMLKEIQETITTSIKDHIKSEIENGFANQTASLEDSVLSVVRSQAQTPAPGIDDIQEQIKMLLSQNQINKAFHQALIANDLNLVEFTIERADFKSVFNPCPLDQTVILSLIQQISADMNHHNELKQKYLSESILNLNFRHPVTKEHAPKVMREIYQKCQDFLANNRTSPMCSDIKMLLMACQGMGLKANIF